MHKVLNETIVPSEEPRPWHIEMVLSVCNRVGFLVRYGMVSEEQAAVLFGGRMLQLWEKLEPEVRVDQAKVNSISWAFYEQFVQTLLRKYWKHEAGRWVFQKRI